MIGKPAFFFPICSSVSVFAACVFELLYLEAILDLFHFFLMVTCVVIYHDVCYLWL
jgi:hypothetical protein